MDHAAIEALPDRHAAWRVLRANNAPLILSFLGRFFVEDNRGATDVSVVAAERDEELYALDVDPDEPRYPKSAGAHLEDLAATDVLRR